MRLAIISDTHGNLPALEAVLDDIQRRTVDELAMVGDFADRGPYPLEVVRLMQSVGGYMIRGNTDIQLVRLHQGDVPGPWRTNQQFASMRWSAEHLDREALDFLASLPEQRVLAIPGTIPIRVVHGTHRSASEGIFPEHTPSMLEWVFANIDQTVMTCGHTHRSWTWEQDNLLAFNPGSVGQPFNGDTRAQYALLAWDQAAKRWQVTLQAVSYDRDRARLAFEQSGYLHQAGAFARACMLSLETGRDTITPFVRHAHRLAAEAGFGGDGVVPDAIWQNASATWDWDAVIDKEMWL